MDSCHTENSLTFLFNRQTGLTKDYQKMITIGLRIYINQWKPQVIL